MNRNQILGTSVILFMISGCKYDSQPVVPRIPKASEVKRITVKLFNLPFQEERLDAFEVPTEYYASLLRFFDPPLFNPDMDERLVSSWQVGKLLILDTRGSTFELCLVWCGKNPATYMLDRVPCVRGGKYQAIEVDGDYEIFADEVLVIASFLIAVKQGDSVEAQNSLSALNISAGRGLADQP